MQVTRLTGMLIQIRYVTIMRHVHIHDLILENTTLGLSEYTYLVKNDPIGGDRRLFGKINVETYMLTCLLLSEKT